MAAPCEVKVEADGIHVVPRGWHRLGALSRGFIIPLISVQKVQVRPDSILETWNSYTLSMRKVGSNIPGKYKAGSFRPWAKSGNRVTTWWLVRHPENTIELDLRGFRYDRIVVEVDDPEGTAAQIRAAIGGENPA